MLMLPKVDKCQALSKSARTVKKIAAAVLTAGVLGFSSIATVSAAEVPSSDQNAPVMLVQHSLDSGMAGSYHYSHSSHGSHSSHMSHYSSRW